MTKTKWMHYITLLAGLAIVTSTTAWAQQPPPSKAAQRAALQKLQQRLWRAQAQFHKLLAKQHKHQLAMGRLRLQQQKLQLKQLKLQETHLKLMLQLRRSQLRQLKLQMELSRRRATLHQIQAAQRKKKAAPKKRATPKKRAAPKQWRGYLVSPRSPVGPKMIMQHPLLRRGQSYVNIVSAEGAFVTQAIVLFGPGPQPKRDGKLLLLTGTARRISLGRKRRRVKGAGYKGLVITVTSWRYSK